MHAARAIGGYITNLRAQGQWHSTEMQHMPRLTRTITKPRLALLAALFVWLFTTGARADSNTAEARNDASARLQARAHLNFRITVLPTIALAAETDPIASLPSTSAFRAGTHWSTLFRSRRGVTSQVVVIDSAHHYTLAQP